jgi:hypothetical protein
MNWRHYSQPSASIRQHLFSVRVLSLLFLTEALVLNLVKLPVNLDWRIFAFDDQGANLAVVSLIRRGLVPTVDFGYGYGLLPLLIGRLWFGLLGLTPSAYAAAMLVVDLLMAWGLARCVAALKAGPAGVALVLVAMPWAALPSYINLAHAVEAVLICHALAEQAMGRKPRALALMTACLFVKPTMAYIYGFLLTVLIVRDCRAGGVRGILRSLAPAAATGVVLVALCAAWFGVKPLVNTLLPLTGAENYRVLNYGFFRGVGRKFWRPEDARPTLYLVTPSGHYLLGTAVLAAAALTRIVRPGGGIADRVGELVVCCAIMHLTFISCFYGDWMSWTYYYYILIIGLVALAAVGARSVPLVLLVAVVALTGHKYPFGGVRHLWKTTRPVAGMSGLWANKPDAEEWQRLREIIGGRRASVIASKECLSLLDPGFAPPEAFLLEPGIPLPAELGRKLDQVASAEMVLVRLPLRELFLDMWWPQFHEALDGCELAYSSTNYQLYRRLRPSKLPASTTRGKKDGRQAQERNTDARSEPVRTAPGRVDRPQAADSPGDR